MYRKVDNLTPGPSPPKSGEGSCDDFELAYHKSPSPFFDGEGFRMRSWGEEEITLNKTEKALFIQLFFNFREEFIPHYSISKGRRRVNGFTGLQLRNKIRRSF